jgi:L-rhamnose-H+ transport protein
MCFVLQVKPERLEEYKQRHRSVWLRCRQRFAKPVGATILYSCAKMACWLGIWRQKILNMPAPEWLTVKSMIAGNARWATFSSNPIRQRSIGAVALGYTAAFGTLMPPIFRGVFASEVLGTHSGLVILGGVAVCLLGIAFAGGAGVPKEREMSIEQKRTAIKEFDLKKGLLVATFSGVMSACFAYGLAAGDPIKLITIRHGTSVLWQGLPVLVVVLAGGFTTNFIWCVILNIRNRTGHQYFQSEIRSAIPIRREEHILEAVTDAPGEEMAVAIAVAQDVDVSAPMFANYLFSALAGTTWYMQFFFYTMGETQIGRYKFSSWTLHMASIIIFSTLWGISLREWKGASGRTWLLVALSLLVLVSSTVIVGYGNYIGASSH